MLRRLRVNRTEIALRIIGGVLRGKKLHNIKGQSIRPTADRIRESLFNILAGTLSGTHVCDLFAGTGALGIEALSRGARTVWFVEKATVATRLIQRNLKECSLLENTRVWQRDIRRSLHFLNAFPGGFDLFFMDPPYGKQLVSPTLDQLCRLDAVAQDARIVVEHDVMDAVSWNASRLALEDRRLYGKTHISFFRFV
ncbi:MAG: 16S rRNA (guanine(966)-N(2))-methyltransferase RsmD [Desulfobacteraceae bacterium]|jgi:16S rRNA (guanine(966)-N(2))-methyltransferase RsmD|nr:16S rRNA (guanine(966)-N(2))-methyltransferase RsmD [Desulfobacteraceae bacterium]